MINRYYDCLNGKESTVEGCVEHVSKTIAEKKMLTDYLNGKN